MVRVLKELVILNRIWIFRLGEPEWLPAGGDPYLFLPSFPSFSFPCEIICTVSMCGCALPWIWLCTFQIVWLFVGDVFFKRITCLLKGYFALRFLWLLLFASDHLIFIAGNVDTTLNLLSRPLLWLFSFLWSRFWKCRCEFLILCGFSVFEICGASFCYSF